MATKTAKKAAPAKKTTKSTTKKPTRATAKKAAKSTAKKPRVIPRQPRSEDHPWSIWVEEHPDRTNSPAYVRSRKKMNELARTVTDFYYGDPAYEDHHGGGLWLKDEDGWFIVRNLAGMEWSAQFCADPKKVDQLRINARRLYARFPEAVEELGIRKLLDTPIKTAKDVATWTDSICNASVPLPEKLHTGVLPKTATKKKRDEVIGGVHHYPAPIVDQQLFKHDDFQLWIIAEGEPVAVVPVNKRGSGDGRTAVIYASPGTELAAKKARAARRHKPLILDEDDELSLRAFSDQYAKIYSTTNPPAPDDPLSKVAKAAQARAARPGPKPRRVAAAKYRPDRPI